MHEWLWQAAEWWVGTAIGGGLVLLAGCGLMHFARPAAARQRIGEWSILGALIVAGLRLLPAWFSLPWSATPAVAAIDPGGPYALSSGVCFEATSTIAAMDSTPADDRPMDLTPVLAAAPVPPQAPVEPWTWHEIAPWMTGAYLLISALLAARWLLGQWALNRLMRQARPAAPRLRRLFTSMSAGTLWPLPLLRLSRRLHAPVCFGIRKPAVLLPESMDDAEDTQLRWVFAHELTHLRRRDPWSSWGIGLAQAVYFYLPWFWWMKRQVRLCQEYVADAAAAEQGEAADEYAEFLVSLAKSPANPLGATGLGTSSDLLRRVQMLLQTSKGGVGSWSRSRSILTAAALLAVAVFAGGIGLRAEPPKEENSDQKKDVLILRKLGDEGGSDVFRLAPEAVQLIVKLDDEESDDKKGEKKSDAKVEKKMIIVVDSGDGPIMIPLEKDFKAEDVKKAIEKAKAKAKAGTEAKQKDGSAAIQKALKALEGELSAEQMKMLKKHLETIHEQKYHVDAARAEAEKARKIAEEARGEAEKAGRVRVFREAELTDAHRKAEEAHKAVAEVRGQRIFAVASIGRLGARVEKPSAALVDQLDLPKDRGVVVVDVVKDSPAAKAGMKVNDVILEIADHAVPSDSAAFMKIIGSIKADDEVNAVVLRKGRKERIQGIKLTESPAGGALWLGGVPMQGKLLKQGDVVIPSDKRQLELKLELEKSKRDLELKKADLEKMKKDFELKFDIDAKGLEDLKKKIAVEIDGKQLEDLKKKVQIHVSPDRSAAPKASSQKTDHKNRNVSISVNDGKFKAVQTEDDVKIAVIGTVNDGKIVAESIAIDEGGGQSTYKRLADVPEKHRGAVKSLISNSEGSPVRFDFRRKDDGPK